MEAYGVELEPFLEQKLLALDGSRLHLTRRGMLVSNEVMRLFV